MQQQKTIAQSHIQSDMWFLSRGAAIWPFFQKVHHHIINILARTTLLPDSSHLYSAARNIGHHNHETVTESRPMPSTNDMDFIYSQAVSATMGDTSPPLFSGDLPVFQSGFGYGVDDWIFDPAETYSAEL